MSSGENMDNCIFGMFMHAVPSVLMFPEGRRHCFIVYGFFRNDALCSTSGSKHRVGMMDLGGHDVDHVGRSL